MCNISRRSKSNAYQTPTAAQAPSAAQTREVRNCQEICDNSDGVPYETLRMCGKHARIYRVSKSALQEMETLVGFKETAAISLGLGYVKQSLLFHFEHERR